MTPSGRPVEEDDLHARLDGQLPRARIEDVDAYLAAHPEVEARFSEYAAQREALRLAFAAPASEPIPERLRAVRDLAGPLGSLPPRAVARMVTADAIAAHRTFSVEVRHPVEVDAGQEVHLVQCCRSDLAVSLSCPISR
jgi:anti-sigma factor RsiW